MIYIVEDIVYSKDLTKIKIYTYKKMYSREFIWYITDLKLKNYTLIKRFIRSKIYNK